MSEMILIVTALFGAVAFTAWLMLTVQKRAQEPLLKEMRYMIRHVAAHDLQVYHGIAMTDHHTSSPAQNMPKLTRGKSPEDLVVEAEELARQFERFNGDLTPTAET